MDVLLCERASLLKAEGNCVRALDMRKLCASCAVDKRQGHKQICSEKMLGISVGI
jgi:hypothetical protein